MLDGVNEFSAKILGMMDGIKTLPTWLRQFKKECSMEADESTRKGKAKGHKSQCPEFFFRGHHHQYVFKYFHNI